jgi:hypothetical protein
MTTPEPAPEALLISWEAAGKRLCEPPITGEAVRELCDRLRGKGHRITKLRGRVHWRQLVQAVEADSATPAQKAQAILAKRQLRKGRQKAS